MNALKHLRFISQAYKHLPGKHDQRKHGRDGGGGSGSGSGGSVALQTYVDGLKEMETEYANFTESVKTAYENGNQQASYQWQNTYAKQFGESHRAQGAAISNMSYDEQDRAYDALPKPVANHIQYASAVSFALYGNPDLRMRAARDLMALESSDDPDPAVRWELANKFEDIVRPKFVVGTYKNGPVTALRPDNGLDVFKPFQYLSLERRLIEAENYGALDARRKFGNSDTLSAQIEFATQQQFIYAFTGLHTSQRTDNIAGAMIQSTLRQVGPNAGKPLPEQFWPAGVKPPEPQPEIVRRLNNEYQTTQFNFTIGTHDQHPNVYTDANGRRYMQLYRGEKLAFDTPMQPWTQNRGVALNFAAPHFESEAAAKGLPWVLRNGYVPQEYIFTSHLSQQWNTRYANESEFLVLGAYGQDVQPSRVVNDKIPVTKIDYTEFFYDNVQLTKTKAYDGFISRLKHLPGKHNQASHGRKRGGSGASGSASDTITIEDIEARRKRNYNVDPDLQTDMFGNAIEETPTPTPTVQETPAPAPAPTKPRLAKYADVAEVLKATGIDVTGSGGGDSYIRAKTYDAVKGDLDALYTEVTEFAHATQSYRDAEYAKGFPTREQRLQMHAYLEIEGEGIATRISDTHRQMKQKLIDPLNAEQEIHYQELKRVNSAMLNWESKNPKRPSSDFPEWEALKKAQSEYMRLGTEILNTQNALNELTLAVSREAYRSSVPAIMPTLPKSSKSSGDMPGSMEATRRGYEDFAEYAYTGIDYDTAVSINEFKTRTKSGNVFGYFSRKGAVSYARATIDVSKDGVFAIALNKDMNHYATAVHEATHVFDDIKPGMYETTSTIYQVQGDSAATYIRPQSGSTPTSARYSSSATMPYPYMKQMYYMTSSFDNDGTRTIPNQQRIYGMEFNSVMSEMIIGVQTMKIPNYQVARVEDIYANPNLVGFWYANMHH